MVSEAISLTPATAQVHPELSCDEKFILPTDFAVVQHWTQLLMKYTASV